MENQTITDSAQVDGQRAWLVIGYDHESVTYEYHRTVTARTAKEATTIAREGEGDEWECVDVHHGDGGSPDFAETGEEWTAEEL